jgi:hypothetical protein
VASFSAGAEAVHHAAAPRLTAPHMASFMVAMVSMSRPKFVSALAELAARSELPDLLYDEG